MLRWVLCAFKSLTLCLSRISRCFYMKFKEGTRQITKPRLYNKNIAPCEKNIRSRTCPVTFLCLTAAVLWPCEGSIIICPVIEGLYEWFDEGFTVSALNHWNLFSRWRNLDLIERQEDPIELKNHSRTQALYYIHYLALCNFSWGDLGTVKASFISTTAQIHAFVIQGISYRRDNSIIFLKSPHRKKSLWPRCWTKISWKVQPPSRVGLFDH